MNRRPSFNGSAVTTPAAAEQLDLLGGGNRHGSVLVTRDQLASIKRLYGFVKEQPRPKPCSPTPPCRADFETGYEGERSYRQSMRLHVSGANAYEKAKDPTVWMQAGADRNCFRHAEQDGLRMLAWMAQFVEPGQDPLKTLVVAMSDAGFDVGEDDGRWASDDETDGTTDDTAEDE